jgi:hypothetical protein
MRLLVVSGPADMDYGSTTSTETSRKRPSSRIRACWECKITSRTLTLVLIVL